VSRKLIVRPRAKIDRASHFLYLSERNPGAALRFDNAVKAPLKKIRLHPQIGANLTLPAVAHLGLRFYRPDGFDKYLIIFRVADDVIYVSRILHGSQDVESAVLEA
jgi:plasmid stabilization system protein ParE